MIEQVNIFLLFYVFTIDPHQQLFRYFSIIQKVQIYSMISNHQHPLQFVLLPVLQYQQMKALINDLTTFMQTFAASFDRTLLSNTIQKFSKHTDSLQQICDQISQQFEDGKINKKVLETQIESLHANLQETREQLAGKDRQIVKYSSQLMKISQQNDKFKEYIRKIKEQNKAYKLQMEELVQSLSAKVKKYKSQYEEKIQAYEAKVKYLEVQLQKTNRVGQDLDRQLEELAMLEAEVEGDAQSQDQ